jgi:hypothetical protein
MAATTLDSRKRADLVSLAGGTLAGFAAGAWFGAALPSSLAPVLLVLGIVVHAVGMTARHRLDLAEGPLPRAWVWLFASCWAMLAGALAWIAITLLRGAP